MENFCLTDVAYFLNIFFHDYNFFADFSFSPQTKPELKRKKNNFYFYKTKLQQNIWYNWSLEKSVLQKILKSSVISVF